MYFYLENSYSSFKTQIKYYLLREAFPDQSAITPMIRPPRETQGRAYFLLST